MIYLDWWQSFAAVYRAGTVTGAARTRHLTQPAVTQHIASLEAEIGEPLFVRMPRRMAPTDRAKALYASVADALDKLDAVSSSLRSGPAAAVKPLRLGAPLEYFVNDVLERLSAVPPRMWVRFGLADELIDALARGELDAVIATQRGEQGGIDYQPLRDEHFLLIGPPGLRMPRKHADAPDAWLSQQTWIAYGAELPIIRRYWRSVFGRRPGFEATYVFPNLHAILRAVELGYGVTVLNDFVCVEAIAQKRVTVLHKLAAPPVNTIWLAHRRADASRPEIVQLWRQLRAAESRP